MISSIQNPKSLSNQGFTLVEIMVALVILAVGLLGMAGMTMVVMRGNRGAEDLASATNVCQQGVENLKDISWATLGSKSSADPVADQVEDGIINQGMVQENDLNAQGKTRADLFTQQQTVPGSACAANTDTPGTPCGTYLDQAGPYKFARTFVVCDGSKYASDGTPPAGSTTDLSQYNSNPDGAHPFPAQEPNCQVDPSSNTIRPSTLSCDQNDIVSPGPNSTEKMIKILCTWRTKEGRCSYVNFQALSMSNS